MVELDDASGRQTVAALAPAQARETADVTEAAVCCSFAGKYRDASVACPGRSWDIAFLPGDNYVADATAALRCFPGGAHNRRNRILHVWAELVADCRERAHRRYMRIWSADPIERCALQWRKGQAPGRPVHRVNGHQSVSVAANLGMNCGRHGCHAGG